MMYRTIIIPVDHDDDDRDGAGAQQLESARRLAELANAELVLVGAPGAVEGHRDRLAHQVTHRYLSHGEPVPEAISDVLGSREPGTSLVVACTPARRRLGYLLDDTPAEEIIRDTGADVLLLGPEFDTSWRPGIGPALVCLDGTDLAEQAVAIAGTWSRTYHGDVHLLRVVSPPTPTTLDPAAIAGSVAYPPGTGAVVVTQPESSSTSEVTDPAETYLEGQSTMLRNCGIGTRVVLRHGHGAAATINDYLTEQAVNVVVMTTHGREGLGRVVFGSTTIAVARHARCPVLTRAPAAGNLRAE